MASVLFIKANDRPKEESVSVRMYHAFYKRYQDTHTDDTLIELDLHQELLPYLGKVMINGNKKKAYGESLTAEEQAVQQIVAKHLEQFVSVDKLVIAFPLWNLSVPAVLHSYLDYMHQPGKTFSYTDQGAVGLLTDKKAALLNARGGVYAEDNRSEMAVSFVRNHLHFFGITDITTLVIEGHHKFPERKDAIIAAGLYEVIQSAATF